MPQTAQTVAVDGLTILKTLPLKIANFCREYIIDFNGKQAAVRAGYSARTAGSIASQLLTKLNVSQAVQALAQQQAERVHLTAERVMTETACVSFVDPTTFFDENGKLKKPANWPVNGRGAVSGYNAKRGEITFHPKVAALTLAARITKIVDSDAVPINMQGNFVVVCPADASPEQWTKLAAAQTIAAKKPPKLVASNGHLPAHANGDGD